MAEINDFDIVDANNTARWPEGMTFAAVNNAARADEGILARFYKDVNGSLATTGAADAYSIAANQTLGAYYSGLWLRAKANFTNAGAATLNVDGLGVKTIVKGAATALVAGDIASGAIYDFVYDGTNFQVFNPGIGSVVVGPGSVTDNNLAQFNGTTGKLVEDSGKSITTVGAGKHTIWVPATAMYKATAAAGPGAAQFAISSSVWQYLAFDAASTEDAHFSVAMPKGWDEGTVTLQAYWFHPATTTNFTVLWQAYAMAQGNADSLSGATFGGPVSMIDTGGTTNTLYVSPESSALTIGNTPAEGDLVDFLIRRLGGDGTDTMAVDALLLGVKVHYTTNANTDD